ncbi:hypothetical protein T310_1279 [Rasamsonia emersonii CBS 393.64]|uniref:Metallo-beta-lactamase domain-containing protein n=1 Tax=Rasamsonia emersonii (strain ATCC 16479 / CBS 393.64 / IMI 116815) TaxID=1408163 RepID=A0A0F4Z3P4_RASE3|nr:hypothetical protein T310_1279 [Rasamsonia emersonii CBS 393.64]KKA24696.1 hypothetical protein T310_1279 [Rasamsonia emersonii CBS 393.64]
MSLRADVYVAPRLPIAIPRAGGPSSFSPISCTLIHGKSEAVLVDTLNQPDGVPHPVDRRYRTRQGPPIHLHHARPRRSLLRHLHVAETLAEGESNSHAGNCPPHETAAPAEVIAQPVALAEPMESPDTFEIEGHVFHAIEVGHSDIHDTTVLHVPDFDLVVAGDVVYGDVHQYFGEANTTEKRMGWIRAIEKIEALRPQTVVAGHKRPGSVDVVYNLLAIQRSISSRLKMRLRRPAARRSWLPE